MVHISLNETHILMMTVEPTFLGTPASSCMDFELLQPTVIEKALANVKYYCHAF